MCAHALDHPPAHSVGKTSAPSPFRALSRISVAGRTTLAEQRGEVLMLKVRCRPRGEM